MNDEFNNKLQLKDQNGELLFECEVGDKYHQLILEEGLNKVLSDIIEREEFRVEMMSNKNKLCPKEEYDPEQWKIEVTKVNNGYIIKNKSENTVSVIEYDDDDGVEGISNMLYYLANEFGGNYRVEINALEHKHDYLKEDFKMMLEDIYDSYNDDSHDVTSETMQQLEEIFGKFKWRDKK